MKNYLIFMLLFLSALFISCKNETTFDYIVELPDEPKGAPVVFMLHGFGGNAENFKQDTQFEKEALPRGYAVVYVNSSAAGWSSGAGLDKSDDVKALCNLAKALQKEYHFNKKRIYAAGYSNGGFMAHRLAVQGKGTFSACICVAGDMSKSVWIRKKPKTKISFFQITGEKDDAVPKHSNGTAEASLDPAIEDVLDYYVLSDGLDAETPAVSTVGNGSILTKYSSQKIQEQVWHLFVADGRHAWPSLQFNKLNVNSMILDFLDEVE